ncbi:MAG: MerR family transcriptional regulator [Proteobacteria bacterium]|nr:MerR family transcriptional regulator [Pseudomonadota bacterium]
MADSVGGTPHTRRKIKAPGAFRTISEVATDLEVPQHVLRFWESKFTQVKPLKRGGGRRYYRPEDVDLLRGIRHLLYSDGYTIKGVQKLLREIGSKSIMESGRSQSGAGRSGAAVVAAARTRRQNGGTEPLASPQAADPSAPGNTPPVGIAPVSGDNAVGEAGLTAVQRGKLSALAVELGELRKILRRPATKI